MITDRYFSPEFRSMIARLSDEALADLGSMRRKTYKQIDLVDMLTNKMMVWNIPAGRGPSNWMLAILDTRCLNVWNTKGVARMEDLIAGLQLLEEWAGTEVVWGSKA